MIKLSTLGYRKYKQNSKLKLGTKNKKKNLGTKLIHQNH